MDKAEKIYSVKIRWGQQVSNKNSLVTVGLEEDGTSTNFKTKLESMDTEESMFICEPPLPARYVKIEKKGEVLQLCEVDVYATGNPLQRIF